MWLRRSRAGLLVAGLFLAAAAGVFTWLMVESSRNPADSGEGGVLLLPFAMPWILWMPEGWLGLGTALGAIGLNAVLLYAIFGGVRPPARGAQPPVGGVGDDARGGG